MRHRALQPQRLPSLHLLLKLILPLHPLTLYLTLFALRIYTGILCGSAHSICCRALLSKAGYFM